MKSAKTLSTLAICLAGAFVFVLCTQTAAQDAPEQAGTQAEIQACIEKLTSRFFKERSEARRSLEKMGQSALKPLLKALRNPHSEVRANAALALGRMKAAEAIGELLQLAGDPALFVRKQTYEALAIVGEMAVGVLQRQLELAEGKRKEFLKKLLGRILYEVVKNYLEETMIDNRKYLYCQGYAGKLKAVGPGVLEALKLLSNWDREEYRMISYYALNAIGDLGDASAKSFLKKKYDEALRANILVQRAGAAMSLAKLGEPKWGHAIISDIKKNVYNSDETGKHSSSGATYLEMGLLDEALKEFLEAKKLAPEDPSYTFRLGCVYGLKGQAKKAISYLKEVVKEGFVKPSMLERIAYFRKIREGKEWKAFIEEAQKKESEKDKDAAEKK